MNKRNILLLRYFLGGYMKLKSITLFLLLCAICSISIFSQSVQKRSSMKGEMIQVEITIDDYLFDAEIEKNDDTLQLLNKLPMDMRMYKLGGSNLLWGGSFERAKGKFVSALKKGELAFCEARYFIIFYEDLPASANNTFMPIGRITSGLENLDKVSNGGNLSIKLK